MNASRPRWPSSCPLLAVSTTSMAGGAISSARSDSQPAHQAAAAFGGGLPPGTARRHHHDRRTRAIAAGDGHDDVAGGRRRASVVRHHPRRRCRLRRRRAPPPEPRSPRGSPARHTVHGNCSAFSRPRPGCDAAAHDDQGAMRSVAAQSLIFAAVDRPAATVRPRRSPHRSRPGPSVPLMPSAPVGGASNTGTASMRPPSSSRHDVDRIDAIERERLAGHRGAE